MLLEYGLACKLEYGDDKDAIEDGYEEQEELIVEGDVDDLDLVSVFVVDINSFLIVFNFVLNDLLWLLLVVVVVVGVVVIIVIMVILW